MVLLLAVCMGLYRGAPLPPVHQPTPGCQLESSLPYLMLMGSSLLNLNLQAARAAARTMPRTGPHLMLCHALGKLRCRGCLGAGEEGKQVGGAWGWPAAPRGHHRHLDRRWVAKGEAADVGPAAQVWVTRTESRGAGRHAQTGLQPPQACGPPSLLFPPTTHTEHSIWTTLVRLRCIPSRLAPRAVSTSQASHAPPAHASQHPWLPLPRQGWASAAHPLC